MKIATLDLLCCPVARSRLAAVCFDSGRRIEAGQAVPDAQPIETGVLLSDEGRAYPIVGGIPRLLPEGLDGFPSFAQQHSDRLENLVGKVTPRTRAKNGSASGTDDVVAQFERQWKWWGEEEKIYGRTHEEWEAAMRTGYISPSVREDFFPGKRVLDAGCGHGCFTRGFAKMGAEVVALERGSGVEVARQRCAGLRNVEFVQGDILHLPLSGAHFDLVYCNGVLPFLPEPEKGFEALASTLKKEGMLRIWVYPKGGKLWETSQNMLRGVLSRLPPRLLYYLCFVPVPLLSFVKTYSGTSLKTSSWRQCAQVVWDYYSCRIQWHHAPEEIDAWYRDAGLAEVQQLATAVSVIGRRLT